MSSGQTTLTDTKVIKIKVGNSTSTITGLTVAQFKAMSNALSYEIDAKAAYFSNSVHSRKRTLLGRRGDFPTGLLFRVLDHLSAGNMPYSVEDTRIIPLSGRDLKASLQVTPYPEQENAAQSILERYRGIVVAPTGSGKSIIIALIIQKLQVRTLIVVPNLELRRQLIDTLTEVFGSDVVGGFGTAIAVENIQALDPKATYTYGCVIIDEFHRSAASSYRKLNKKAWNEVFYRVGLTATPFRSKDSEQILLESIISEVVYKIDHEVAVSKGYIVPLEAYYIELPKQKVKGYTWAEVYKELVVENMHRCQIIANILDRARDNEIPTLCLVKEIQHGHNIIKEAEYTHPFAKGENEDNRELLKELEWANRKTLVGTTGVLGEGVDTKPCEVVIIAGLGKSRPAFMQQVGRALRTYPGKVTAKVILFKDSSHKWTLTHYREQVRVLREEYGIKPVRLDI